MPHTAAILADMGSLPSLPPGHSHPHSHRWGEETGHVQPSLPFSGVFRQNQRELEWNPRRQLPGAETRASCLLPNHRQ